MYDWPELRSATDRLWAGLRRALTRRSIDAPPELIRDRPLLDVWRHPDLLFSHTCGAPLIGPLDGVVDYVGTPVFDAEGWSGPCYSSAVVVRRDRGIDAVAGLDGATAAVNGPDSISGFWSLATLDARPGAVVVSGAHRASAGMVARGKVDFAAIDAQSWRLLSAAESETAAALEVIGWTALVPATPFITSVGSGAPAAALFEAFQEALADPETAVAAREIGLVGVERLSVDAYRETLDPLMQDARMRALADSL